MSGSLVFSVEMVLKIANQIGQGNGDGNADD